MFNMFKKMSFLVAALFATVVLMGCDQHRKTETTTGEQGATGKIENAESGAMTPSQPAPTEEAKKPAQ